MKKEDYNNRIQKYRKSVLDEISGCHELGNVLLCLSNYIDNCIQLTLDIYNDKDIDYRCYLDLNENINNNLKEVCRIVKNS